MPSKQKAARKPVAPPAVSDNPAYGIIEPLGVIVLWSRQPLFEGISAGLDQPIERSAVSILGMLARHGSIRMSRLAQLVGLDRSTISRQIGAVVDSGFVERIEDTADARATLLTLTAAGRSVQQKLDHAWRSIAMSLVADWDYDDQVDFSRLLTRFAAGMAHEVDRD